MWERTLYYVTIKLAEAGAERAGRSTRETGSAEAQRYECIWESVSNKHAFLMRERRKVQ